MSKPVVALRRSMYRAAYAGLRVWWYVRRPETQGVKLVVRDRDVVLFVRHAYGDRRSWDLPGGGLKRGETAIDAARREALEELGVSIDRWTVAGAYECRDHATAHLSCLVGAIDGRSLTIDHAQLEEIRWATLTCPPGPLGRHATAVLELLGVTPMR